MLSLHVLGVARDAQDLDTQALDVLATLAVNTGLVRC